MSSRYPKRNKEPNPWVRPLVEAVIKILERIFPFPWI
jgi:hypothetical protein